MKKLVAIGASLAAFAIAAWLVRSPSGGDAGTTKSPELAPALPAPRDRLESAEPSPAAKPAEPVALAAARESARAPSARRTPTDEPPSEPAAAGPIDEAQQLAQCRALWERERKAEQAARAAEAKDSAWAYTTEQKLHEYLSRRFRTSPIEVTRIDCRATFCEITGQSFAPEGANEFSLALQGVQQESWSDFTGSSFSQSVEAGKAVYSGEVRRKQSYATAREQRETPEQSACMTLVGRRNQRERAARDAQPRDTGWADPMEQLLRMHLAAQLTRHPVELDITCRTTFCSIKAKGRSNDALLALQKAMMAVESEPWANLRNGEAGSTGNGDSWTADYTLHRR
jgi:hypothetical protein